MRAVTINFVETPISRFFSLLDNFKRSELDVGIYDNILFLFNLEFFLYDHDQIFKTRINLDILDGFDTIQQQEQDIVLE